MKQFMHSTMRLAGVSIGLLAAASGARAAIDITDGRTKNMRCSHGLCMPIAKGASLNIHELARRLAESDVKVVTANGAMTIEVTGPLSWASSHRLILAAGYNIGVKAPVTVAGPGRLTIATGANGAGGSLRFRGRGKIDFWDPKARLVINGNAYELSNDVVTLADGIAQHPSAHFALARDYDARGDDFGAHTPIATTFKGVFEGLGHSIANVSIHDKSDRCVGLFASISASGIVRDIALPNAAVSLSLHRYARSGALAGCNEGVVEGASASGTVIGTWSGGLVGYNGGLIANSSADVAVTGKLVGGLTGLSDGTIFRSHAEGSVYASAVVADAGRISLAGGLAGMASAITQSFATGNVTIDSRNIRFGKQDSAVGGLVGLSFGPIADSYATGAVRGGRSSPAGGLAGQDRNAGTIRASYATGAVSAVHDDASILGGFIGRDSVPGDLAGTYWDLDTSGIGDPSRGAGNIPNDPGITGLSDMQLKSALPAGFNPAIWGQDANINNGYPYLLANPPPQ